MKKIALLCCFGALLGSAAEVTIAKSTMLKAEKSALSLKAGTVVEVISRDEKTLTVRYNKLTGTIPASSVAAAAAASDPAKKETAKPAEPPPPPRKAETTYGKAVEKARENASKHEKNLVKPADEITDK